MHRIKIKADGKKKVNEFMNFIRPSDLSESILLRQGTRAVRTASARAMQMNGHVVKAQGGWVVREDKSGKLTRISKIEVHERPKKLNLD